MEAAELRLAASPESIRAKLPISRVQKMRLAGLCMGVVDDAQMEETSAAVGQVYQTEALKMWRAIVGYTGDPEIANDAVSEAFARALQHEGSIQDIRAWTWRVAFRVASAESRARLRGDDESPLDVSEPSPEAVDLVAALRQLSDRQRLAVVLHDYADRPTTEVAAILGCSPATVHVHLGRGRRRLRALLGERDA
jgi:RNA polymerase sigma-70 factor (ECF subfamily)